MFLIVIYRLTNEIDTKEMTRRFCFKPPNQRHLKSTNLNIHFDNFPQTWANDNKISLLGDIWLLFWMTECVSEAPLIMAVTLIFRIWNMIILLQSNEFFCNKFLYKQTEPFTLYASTPMQVYNFFQSCKQYTQVCKRCTIAFIHTDDRH